MAADLLARVHAEITGRLAELRPAVDEYERLLGAAEALESPAATPAGASSSAASAIAAEEPALARARPAPTARRAAKAPTARRAAKAPAAGRPASGRRRGRPSAVELAIVAALEDGSHTLAELGVVTAMSGAELREGVRRLLTAGKIVRASREGRAAYALSGSE